MTAIPVNTSRRYAVQIEAGALERLGQLTADACGAGKAMLVSDDTVDNLYGQRARQALQRAGFQTERFVFPHGEGQKTPENYLRLQRELLRCRLSRADIVVALGGGVVGDLAGFAAATYLRGIRWVQVPTTLLAAVDAAVGGKTAVNLPEGKNQIGAIWQPSLVVCDPALLQTLPAEQYRSGCAEVIKCAVLQDAGLFSRLQETPVSAQYEAVIAACVGIKSALVEADELDCGSRRLLNLGHTVGHAIERCSDYQIPHGQAVAAGMAVITRAACRRGICSQETLAAVEKLLRQYGLPTGTDFSAAALAEAAMADKKRSGETLHLIVPEQVGHCRIEAIPVSTLTHWLRDGGIV